MGRTVFGNMLHRLIDIPDYPDIEDKIEILIIVVLLFHAVDIPQYLSCLGTSLHYDSCLIKPCRHIRQKVLRNLFIDEHRLHRIARRGPLYLGVKTYILGHLKVSIPVDKDMTDALVMLQDGYP